MFNLKSNEQADDKKDKQNDKLLNDLNTIYNHVLNNDLNSDLHDVCDNVTRQEFDETRCRENDESYVTNSKNEIHHKRPYNDEENNHVKQRSKRNTHSHENYEDYQYLFWNSVNGELIVNSKDFISFANENLHEFLLYDQDRINFKSTASNTCSDQSIGLKRKAENKSKSCDNDLNSIIFSVNGGCETNASSANLCSSSSPSPNKHLNNNASLSSSSIKSSPSSSSFIKSSNSHNTQSQQQLSILNFKSLVFDRSKRKLLKLLLKLKEKEKNENDDLTGLQIRKDCQLLARYIREEKLSHLILKLYPQNQGYSISLKKIYDKNSTRNSTITSNIKVLETIKLPYEETELLDFIDNEQIPPMLLDVLDSNCDSDEHLDLFHFGKLFVEIQDYRRNASIQSTNCESKFVLLKPTIQTILNDVEKLTSNSTLNNDATMRQWSSEEKLELESKLVLATADPICLDPNPLTFLSSNQLNYEKKWLNSDRIRNVCRKSSQVYLNQVEKFSELPAPRNLELFDFIKRKHKNKHIDIAQHKINKSINDHMFVKENHLSAPKSCLEDMKRFTKVIEIPNRTDSSMTKLEEYVMECTESLRNQSTTSITIFYRQIDDTYFGQLSVDKNVKKILANGGGQSFTQPIASSSSSACLFKLGNKQLTKKYIEQFIEILSEHGRKCIKITTKRPGEQPRVNYTKKFFANVVHNSNPNASSSITNHSVSQNHEVVESDSTQVPVKKIKPSFSSPFANGSTVGNMNQNCIIINNECHGYSNFQVSSTNASSLNSSMMSSNPNELNQSIPSQINTNEYMNQQHPILSSNLMQYNNQQNINHESSSVLSRQMLITDNHEQKNTKNIINLNSSLDANVSNTNNSMNLVSSGNLKPNLNSSSTSSEMIIPIKSPYAQMSILEKNSKQLQQQQQQQSNDLIANNPILNNLITNNTTTCTNLVQNTSNFIQLNSKSPKQIGNLNITTNGFVNDTMQLNQALITTNQSPQQHQQQQSSNAAYIDSSNMNTNLNSIAIAPVPASLNSLNRLNTNKNETVAVILTTNSLSNSNFISTNNNNNLKTNNINGPSIIQISSSGQTTSTSNLPTGVNLSSLALTRGQNLRVHNLVSLANVQGTNQCFALPISLMMTSPGSSVQQTQNTQPNFNENMVVGLQDSKNKQIGTDHSLNTNSQTQNVLLINNLEHTAGNQLTAYQSHAPTAQFSLGNINVGKLTSSGQIQQTTATSTTNLSQAPTSSIHLNLTADSDHFRHAPQQQMVDASGLNAHFSTNYSNQHSTIVNPITVNNSNSILQSSNHHSGSPIAIHLTTAAAPVAGSLVANHCDQQPTSSIAVQHQSSSIQFGSQQVLTLQKNDM